MALRTSSSGPAARGQAGYQRDDDHEDEDKRPRRAAAWPSARRSPGPKRQPGRPVRMTARDRHTPNSITEGRERAEGAQPQRRLSASTPRQYRGPGDGRYPLTQKLRRHTERRPHPEAGDTCLLRRLLPQQTMRRSPGWPVQRRLQKAVGFAPITASGHVRATLTPSTPPHRVDSVPTACPARSAITENHHARRQASPANTGRAPTAQATYLPTEPKVKGSNPLGRVREPR
ncbi:MAG: hypothetical protein QOI48_2896 [Solirubrobacteraceae bacterium]|jgi:hypothetical protein|nr:hypothetical protein [Solirubrobacteraceae bacterium]